MRRHQPLSSPPSRGAGEPGGLRADRCGTRGRGVHVRSPLESSEARLRGTLGPRAVQEGCRRGRAVWGWGEVNDAAGTKVIDLSSGQFDSGSGNVNWEKILTEKDSDSDP